MNLKVQATDLPKAPPEFLTQVPSEPITEDALTKLEAAVERFQNLEAEVETLKETLSEKTKTFLAVSQVEIPELLHQYGLSEIKLKNKKKVIVSQGVSVSVPDEKQETFNDFLKAHDAEDLVKLQISFGRMPESMQRALFAFIGAMEYEYEAKKAVHPSTLKKYVSDLLGLNLEEIEREEAIKSGSCLRMDDLKDVMNVFTFFSTKIKEPK